MTDKNDQRALLAVTLSLLVFTLWTWLYGPASVPQVQGESDAVAQTVEGGAPPAGSPAQGTPALGTPALGTPASAEGPCEAAPERVQNDKVRFDLDNCGRMGHSFQMEQVSAPVVVTPWWMWIYQVVSGQGPGSWAPVREVEGPLVLVSPEASFGVPGFGEVEAGAWQVTRRDGGSLYRRVRPDGVLITAHVRATDEPDVFEVTYRWESDRAVRSPLTVTISDPTLPEVDGAYDTAMRLTAGVDGDLETLLSPGSPRAGLDGPVNWFGLSNRYYMAVLVPEDPTWGTLEWGTPSVGRPAEARMVAKDDLLEPGRAQEARFRLYVGPKDAERLVVLGSELELAANLGFFALFGKIFLFLLHVLQKGLVNWGLAIAALTLLVRATLWPIMRSSFLAGKKMQMVAPKIKELQEKYADDREAMGKATFALYAEHKVNPVSGCLPALVQIPIFLGLFNGLQSEPELYRAGFLYIYDLSMPDPYGFLPALMTLGMWLQQRMMPMTGLDPTQQTIMKFMPFMFAAFMFTMPAGLQVYYVVNTALALFQQWFNIRNWEFEQQKLATA